MPFTTAPLNPHEPMVTDQRRPSKTFLDWVLGLTQDVDASPAREKRVSLANQSAAISTTSIPTGSLPTGLYRVSWWLRITTAAGSSSSLTVTIGSVDNGDTVTQSGAALTGNSTTVPQSGAVLVRADAATPITYAVAYSSAGAPDAVYDLEVVLERVDA